MYVDFHAHCTKRGCFIFGNTIQDQDMQYEAMSAWNRSLHLPANVVSCPTSPTHALRVETEEVAAYVVDM